ncbi:vitamin K epoxide reductase family protein [Flavobacterium silvaticum]|uniref:Vitamin K epoxide reductase family protein n=1 Tax=Flavobacterium silvaticum TaxID=1852020 RepID=A0A972FUW1_9FLAO|nr:vitamin K epoxide reductase family protein [Flavobacterium silvaticum]NMH28492.1 vitamin K epoxide reductase family protein [Flavobacterium silvaticum]
MKPEFDYLFRYLKSSNILLDKDEFIFQVKCHPDYPSLLSISETLAHFDVTNYALRTSDLDSLPQSFIGMMNFENSEISLCYIEKKGTSFICHSQKGALRLSKEDFIKKWDNLAFIVNLKNNSVRTKSIRNSFLQGLCVSFFITLLFYLQPNFFELILVVCSLIGGILAIGAQEKVFDSAGAFVQSLCSIGKATSCTNVINSKKWKLFQILNFSDLSITYFATQLLGYSYFKAAGNIPDFLIVISFFLMLSLPLILISIYYQKYVEKKWCPICILISGVLVIEMFFWGRLIFINEGK